jgi:riboflavin biosynthesis pyrimidine reductase
MTKGLLQLYPTPGRSVPLEGIYLAHALHRRPEAETPFVYGNFISSLDGRIALPAPHKATRQVPAALANPRDWRLYQELAAQADLLVTSARYFRQLASGEAQDLLPVGEQQRFADLHSWRGSQGLSPQPDIAILSASLEIPVETLASYADRSVHIFTGEDADPEKLAALEAAGTRIHLAGTGHAADGRQVVQTLAAEGYRSIYVIAGPSVLFTLLQANMLNRLYLTFAHKLLAGEDFDTFTWGQELHPAQAMRLVSLFYDEHAPEDAGQLLSCYDCLQP